MVPRGLFVCRVKRMYDDFGEYQRQKDREKQSFCTKVVRDPYVLRDGAIAAKFLVGKWYVLEDVLREVDLSEDFELLLEFLGEELGNL